MRGIRGLVLAAITIAALAISPAAASASAGIFADEYPATLHGSQLSEFYFGINGGAGSCHGMDFEAALEVESPPSVLTSTIEDCESGGGITGVELNGCQLELHPAGAGSVGIGPSGCGPAKLWWFGCPSTFTVPAQGDIAAAYENVGAGSEAHFHIDISDANVEYVAKSNVCGVPAGTHNNMEMAGTFDVTATAWSEPTGARAITGGVFLAGGSGEAEPRLDAVEYPVTVTGEPSKSGQVTLLSAGEVDVTCGVAEYDGGELTGPAYNEFALSASYSQCEIAEVAMTASMNSCRYVYASLDRIGEGKYKGIPKIACEKAGDGITVSGSGCTVKIPAQVFGGGTEMENADVKGSASVVATTDASGIDYTAQNVVCGLVGIQKGSYENGTATSATVLRGEFPG